MPILKVLTPNVITSAMIQANAITTSMIQNQAVVSADLASNISFSGEYITVPNGTTSSRPGSAANGMLRYNTTTTRFEGYRGTWGSIGGGATGGGNDEIFYENNKTVTVSYTVAADKNAVSAGPISITPGVTVTVLGDWTIV